jgi:hypothetical protein
LYECAADGPTEDLDDMANGESRTVAARARCLNLLFGDIISCSLLLRILVFMTYRRSAVGERAAVMDAGGADGE